MTQLVFTLPDEVAERAKEAGLLSDGVIQALLEDAMRTLRAPETIEARLSRKAAVADSESFVTPSLGQMNREQRKNVLYPD